ncbi:unnamed protein product [Protopolystoma xenopodis]|uniref:Uncharacterized protein n=1 Tax=Protopolystoma xenopodis TaxID=117903 RepID=A0A3S5AM98_9PLAT|nr:unnamed protein product [Protopolystoma xenopodis]
MSPWHFCHRDHRVVKPHVSILRASLIDITYPCLSLFIGRLAVSSLPGRPPPRRADHSGSPSHCLGQENVSTDSATEACPGQTSSPLSLLVTSHFLPLDRGRASFFSLLHPTLRPFLCFDTAIRPDVDTGSLDSFFHTFIPALCGPKQVSALGRRGGGGGGGGGSGRVHFHVTRTLHVFTCSSGDSSIPMTLRHKTRFFTVSRQPGALLARRQAHHHLFVGLDCVISTLEGHRIGSLP